MLLKHMNFSKPANHKIHFNTPKGKSSRYKNYIDFMESRNKSSQSSRTPHSSSSIKGKSYNIGLSGIGGAAVARDASGGLVGGGIIVDSLS